MNMEMHTTKKNEFTVQRMDTAVPVGSGVPRTGPTRPSSIDCSVPSVGNQAEAQVQLTGMDADGDETEREYLLAHLGEGAPGTAPRNDTAAKTTPRSAPQDAAKPKPEREEVMDTGNGATARKEDTGRAGKKIKKRRLEHQADKSEEEEEQEAVAKLQVKQVKLLKQMEKEARKLEKVVSENPNTKKEVKEIAAAMRSIVAQMTTTEMWSMVRTTRPPKHDTAPAGAVIAKKPDTKEIATQTETPPTKTEKPKQLQKSQLSAAKDYAGYQDLKKYEWPEDLCTVEHREGTEPPPSYDLVVWDEGEKRCPQTKQMFQKHPELEELSGQVTYLYLTTKKVEADGKTDVTEKILTKVETDGTEEDCFGKLLQVKEFMAKNGRATLALYPPVDEGNGDTLRRMAECVFGGGGTTNIRCAVYYRGGRRAPPKAAMREREKTDALIVTCAKEQTYADLLRSVKEKIKNQKDATEQIKSIRQARDGRMVIAVKPGQQRAGELKSILTKDMDIRARVSTAGAGGRAETLLIKGMDAVTTKSEVTEALKEVVGPADTERTRVGDLRPYYGSSQAVTVVMPQEAADKLLQKGEIRVGYNWCTVKKRVNLVQCYKCWHYGHTAVECEEEVDRGEDCRNCGRAGHRQRDCSNRKHCPLSNRAGHCAGSGACPYMREALATARRKEEHRARRRVTTMVAPQKKAAEGEGEEEKKCDPDGRGRQSEPANKEEQ